MKTVIMLGIIHLLVLVPIANIAKTYAMTPAQDGREGGIAGAFANAHDSIATCDKYETVHNDNSTAPTQCYNAYDLAFNQTCLAHPSLMKYRDPYPEHPSCHDILDNVR
jgi:hypothetical protein